MMAHRHQVQLKSDKGKVRTDRHKARPFMGIRASFISHDWTYNIVTLGCHVLPVHTAREIADHVLKVVGEFIDHRTVLLSTCHDGAANMKKSSKLLKVENFQHCTAHALHLLLTVDSVNKIDELVALLQKCRDIVTSLHFKSTLMEDEFRCTEDKALIDALCEKMSCINTEIDLDNQYAIIDEVEEDDDTVVANMDKSKTNHRHFSLKGSCPTRWNSSLSMIESIIDLKRETMNVLKRIGKAEMCLNTDEFELLEELQAFLKPFATFTDMVSKTMPTLSLIPLIKHRIKKMCVSLPINSPTILNLKENILHKVESRLPESEAIRVHQLLDPSTKDVVARDEAVRRLQNVVKQLSQKGFVHLQTPTSDDDSGPNPNDSKKWKQEMVNDMRQRNSVPVHDIDEVALEITKYLSSRDCVADDDILQFWQDNVRQYPVLSQVAKLYLAMSASSVPVEAMFSTTGLIANSKRCMIGADKLHRISFLHDNFKYML